MIIIASKLKSARSEIDRKNSTGFEKQTYLM